MAKSVSIGNLLRLHLLQAFLLKVCADEAHAIAAAASLIDWPAQRDL